MVTGGSKMVVPFFLATFMIFVLLNEEKNYQKIRFNKIKKKNLRVI